MIFDVLRYCRGHAEFPVGGGRDSLCGGFRSGFLFAGRFWWSRDDSRWGWWYDGDCRRIVNARGSLVCAPGHDETIARPRIFFHVAEAGDVQGGIVPIPWQIGPAVLVDILGRAFECVLGWSVSVVVDPPSGETAGVLVCLELIGLGVVCATVPAEHRVGYVDVVGTREVRVTGGVTVSSWCRDICAVLCAN